MLYTIDELVRLWNLKPGAVVHVGAHLGEELEDYLSNSLYPIYWIEAQVELAEALARRVTSENSVVICATAWEDDGTLMDLNIASNSQSTSLLDFGSHETDYPDIVVTRTQKVVTSRLESLIPQNVKFSLLNIDVQGTELQVLRGAGSLLNNFQMIYCEVNRKEVYRECALVNEIDEYLKHFGFHRKSTRWILRKGWGDAIWVKDPSLSFTQNFNSCLMNLKFYWIHIESYIRSRLKGLKDLD